MFLSCLLWEWFSQHGSISLETNMPIWGSIYMNGAFQLMIKGRPLRPLPSAIIRLPKSGDQSLASFPVFVSEHPGSFSLQRRLLVRHTGFLRKTIKQAA